MAIVQLGGEQFHRCILLSEATYYHVLYEIGWLWLGQCVLTIQKIGNVIGLTACFVYHWDECRISCLVSQWHHKQHTAMQWTQVTARIPHRHPCTQPILPLAPPQLPILHITALAMVTELSH
jgi:hypothetical protein